MPKVVTPEEGYKFIQDRIDTKEWWLVPIATDEAGEFVREMKDRFYQGDNKVLLDFVLIAGPESALLLALASKSCCSCKDLATIVHNPPGELEGRDVLIHSTTPIAVVAWLNGTFKF